MVKHFSFTDISYGLTKYRYSGCTVKHFSYTDISYGLTKYRYSGCMVKHFSYRPVYIYSIRQEFKNCNELHRIMKGNTRISIAYIWILRQHWSAKKHSQLTVKKYASSI